MTSNSGALKHLPPLSASTFQDWKNLVFSYCSRGNLDDHLLTNLVAGEKDAVARVALLSQKSEAAGIIGENLGVEFYAKFVTDENQKQPHTLWSTICSHFESSSKENQSMVYLDFLKVGFTENGGLSKLITDLDVSIANLRNSTSSLLKWKSLGKSFLISARLRLVQCSGTLTLNILLK
ncbi:hypothetical protein MJO28_013351 [Puccinia striiformis f. sp. tritici]|uniref:Uncharacterized protein n=1 Tax=Puccinia striiformis f. sp. tritici TaxID=168172 RepID=A0ACC0DY95_9BASI|nr:hypothetical protein MJO28_013351 [Puccinia striiformis f. sp. tritici]